MEYNLLAVVLGSDGERRGSRSWMSGSKERERGDDRSVP
jgi:hypothetical protein